MKYDLLLLDADDTLFDYKKGEEFALKKTLDNFEIDLPFEFVLDLYKIINTAIWKQFELGEITAEELKPERFNRLFKSIGIDSEPGQFSEAYLENLSYATYPVNGAEELVAGLFGKVRMAIITNGLTKVQRPRFNRSRIGPFMDEYIISEEIGLQKPDKAIFEYALTKLDHSSKTTALMIGDNLNSDILGGINFGIDTCWFNPNKRNPDNGIIPTYTISELKELKLILE